MNQLTAMGLVKRRLPSIPYQAGVRNSIAIDRDGVLGQTNIRLAYRVTNGATGPVTPLAFTLARLIRRLEITLDGLDTVVSLPGFHIAKRATWDWGVRPFGMDATIVTTNSAVTDYEIVLPLAHFLPRAERPDDTAIDLRRLAQATLAITWGDASDLFGTPNGATVSNVTCSIEGFYIVNERTPDKNGGWRNGAYATRVLDLLEQPNLSTNANLAILQDRSQSVLWRSWHMLTTRNNVAVQNILTGDFRMYAGATFFEQRDPVAVLAETQRTAALPVSEYPAGERGYRIDRTWLGSMKTSINAAALSGDLYIAVGTTYTSGTEMISISREMVRP